VVQGFGWNIGEEKVPRTSLGIDIAKVSIKKLREHLPDLALYVRGHCAARA
jgi:hypothetical protein